MAFSTHALRTCQMTAATARLVDMAVLVAVSAALYGRHGAAAVAVFGVVRTAAPAVGTPLVTAASTRWEPRTALAVCAGTAGAGTAALGLVLATDGSVVLVHLLGGLTGVALLCLRPLVTSLLPSLITRPAELVASNAASALVDGASALAGPLLAGAALATLGAPAALAGCTVALAAATAAVATVRVARPVPTGARRESHWSRQALAASWTLVTHRGVRLVVGLAAAQTFVRGALNVLVVVMAVTALGMGDGGIGLLLGAVGVGSLLGLPVAVRWTRPGRLGRSFAWAVLLWGAPIALVAGATDPTVALLLLVVVGVGNAMVDIASDSLLQRLVPADDLPRVLGAFDAALLAAMALGSLFAERLLVLAGLVPALVATGLLLPVLAGVTWPRLHRLDRRLAVHDTDVALLQLHGIFAPLVVSAVDHLTRVMGREHHEPGGVIIRKGELGDRFLVVEQGTVEIVDDGRVLAVLGPGEGFGEMSLLDDVPRNATARAVTPVRLRSLRREDFLAALTHHDHARTAAHQIADGRRSRHPSSPPTEGAPGR